MSALSGARALFSRSAVAPVSSDIEPIASPIGLRSAASPLTSFCMVPIRFASWSPRELTVPSTVFRLLIRSPITLSLAAMVEVSEAVRASRLSTVPPSPCST